MTTQHNKEAQAHLTSDPAYKAEQARREAIAKYQRERDERKAELDSKRMDTMTRQGIETKYLGATNHKPGRIKATAAAGSITMSYEHELNADENHARAAIALAAKFEWTYSKIATGGNAKGDGYVHVLIG